MIKLLQLIAGVLMLTVGCQSTKQQVQKPDTEICGYKVYYSLGGLAPEMRNMLYNEGFSKLVLINQRNIDGRKEGVLDVEILKKAVLRTMPDPKSTKMVVLDWEGSVMDAIIGGKKKDPAAFAKATALYRRAYEIVKEMRPNTTVGFYGFPIRNYHKRNDSWREKNRELDSFFGEFDALFPSIYDFYTGGSKSNRWQRDIDYARENTEEAIGMGKRINKPVFPFVWHRYHPSNKKKGKELIPKEEFSAHLAAIVEAQAGVKKIDGLVWWGSEYSQFATKNKRIIERKQLRSAWEAKAKTTLPMYTDAIVELLRSQCDSGNTKASPK